MGNMAMSGVTRREFFAALAIAVTVAKMPSLVSGPQHTVRVTLVGVRDGAPFREVATVTRDSWPAFVEIRDRWLADYNADRLTNVSISIDHPYSDIRNVA